VGLTTLDSRSPARPQPDIPRAPADPLAAEIALATQRAQAHLLGLQRPEGYWVGELIVDATLVADMVAYHHWDRNVDALWQQKAVKHIFDRQLDDGGWNIYPGGPAEVNATIKCYLALKLAGVSTTDPRMLRARAMAKSLGGVPRMNTFSKLYLALIGLYPWKYVPTIPCEVLLIGKWFHVNFWEMSNWSRAMLVPLAIINHFRPTRPVNVTLDEIYPDGFHERDLALPRDPQWFTWRNFFLDLDGLHKFAERVQRLGLHPFRKLALKKAEQWMLERFEHSHGLAAIFPAMLNALIALRALGYSHDHPEVVRAYRELKNLEHDEPGNLRIEPCFSPVWDTAIVAICLRESGVPADHPQLRRAADWLMDREIRFKGDWIHKNTADVELLALRLIDANDPKRARECVERATKWMMTFQCRDGGWAAFDKDCTKGILEKVPFADHNAMLDPECADITARILEYLGKAGFPKDHPQVKRGVQYVKSQQEADGSWFGRWGVNYIYGTWQVLRGMQAMGWDMTETWLVRGRDWLEKVQLPDGGWGETCATYDDPEFKGQGPATASQTAWALMGILACGDPHRESVRRGFAWLCRQQNADGSWTEDAITGTGFPRVFYLKYDMYRNAWPLLALASWRQATENYPSLAGQPVRSELAPLTR
jgi:squalene-hopene/tetraprenyl-beta-curcumene cyclase